MEDLGEFDRIGLVGGWCRQHFAHSRGRVEIVPMFLLA